MKKLILSLLLAVFSFNLFAESSLICNDQNSHAVYQLDLSEGSTKLVLTPLLRDLSTLSLSVVNLRFNEGESGDNYSLFEGKNLDKNIVIIELDTKSLVAGRVIEAQIFYTKNNPKMLDQRTLFLCTMN